MEIGKDGSWSVASRSEPLTLILAPVTTMPANAAAAAAAATIAYRFLATTKPLSFILLLNVHPTRFKYPLPTVHIDLGAHIDLVMPTRSSHRPATAIMPERRLALNYLKQVGFEAYPKSKQANGHCTASTKSEALLSKSEGILQLQGEKDGKRMIKNES